MLIASNLRGILMNCTSLAAGLLLAMAILPLPPVSGQVLDPQRLLDRETFWDNRDRDWYSANIPFFECPDADIQTTYYYRWELVTKHLTYGSPNTGYTFTEFIDRPFWSGTYGAISCPAGHHLYEVRWLADPRYARDYARYWFRTPGAQPRRYSTWLADAMWALHRVHPDAALVRDLLPDLVKNYEGWEKRQFVPAVGLFWQTGHDDGMEYNINSRQTKDPNAGAPGYRPTLNAYLWADALAIARVADLANDPKTAATYRAKAVGLKSNLQKKLWDPKRQFFFHMAMRDEEANGFTVKALSLTHQTGKFAGSPHGRELIGYVPWQFGLPDPGYEAAWKLLLSKDHFAAENGPTTVERKDPLFALSKTCCWWSGASWPYATTQTLKAMANLLQDYKQDAVTKADYVKLLQTYARTHRKAGTPYIAEACHPDTGSWEGHDSYNHSEHYFHSGYCDLVITGLVGLRPRDDDTLEVWPLASSDWPYFALDSVPYRGQRLGIFWDRDGSRYRLGRGLRILVNGKEVAHAERIAPLSVTLPHGLPPARQTAGSPVNFAVNNDGHYFPRATASVTAPGTSTGKLIDGNFWYHISPPNRWTSTGSTAGSDWVAIDFGAARRVNTVKLFFLDDGAGIVPPAAFELEHWDGREWVAVPGQDRSPKQPAGRRANIVSFPALEVAKLRAVFRHADGGRTGLTEFEAWGEAGLPVAPAPPPTGNLAHNTGNRPFPKVSASFTSRFDKVGQAIDGVTSFAPSPHNRWTSYESPNASDWLEIDFGGPKSFSRIELAIFEDRGGVRAPERYDVQYWDGTAWRDVADAVRQPERPAGGEFNEVRFKPVTASKVRVVFTHRGKSRSGVTELYVWEQ
jgi:hypothetical protein